MVQLWYLDVLPSLDSVLDCGQGARDLHVAKLGAVKLQTYLACTPRPAAAHQLENRLNSNAVVKS